jgi:hypothetical protein
MDIPNLSNQPTINQPSKSLKIPGKKDYLYYSLVIVVAIAVGFGISRFFPSQSDELVSQQDSLVSNQAAQIVEGEEIKAGVVYGNTSQTFADSAVGVVKKGGVNGEGTHTLDREGGADQDAALTSSVVDLDLFIDKKVEVDGETNDSNKAGWFMDVGSIKILE